MTEEFKKLIEAQIEAKKKQELEKNESQLKEDEEAIERAISLINTHTLYKDVKRNGRHVYELATEETFKNDYMKTPTYSWQEGIRFFMNSFNEKVNTGIIEVNGETYYDIRYALNSYEKHVEELKNSLNHLKKQIKDKETAMELLNEQFPTLKKVIEEWQTYESEGEA